MVGLWVEQTVQERYSGAIQCRQQ